MMMMMMMTIVILYPIQSFGFPTNSTEDTAQGGRNPCWRVISASQVESAGGETKRGVWRHQGYQESAEGSSDSGRARGSSSGACARGGGGGEEGQMRRRWSIWRWRWSRW